MRIVLAATLLVCCAPAGFAQDHGTENLCNPASAATLSDDGGVIVQRLVLSDRWGSNEATVYLPQKETADGAVVFSHSAIPRLSARFDKHDGLVNVHASSASVRKTFATRIKEADGVSTGALFGPTTYLKMTRF